MTGSQLMAPGAAGWITSVVLDSVDPERLALFWAGLLGLDVRPVGDSRYVALGRPPAGVPEVVFQRVPEAKSGKVRIHLDVGVHDLDDAAQRVLALGGSVADDLNESEEPLLVVRDPEGHEFCLISRGKDEL